MDMLDTSSIKNNKKNKKDEFSLFALIAKLIPSGWRGLGDGTLRLQPACSHAFSLGGGV